MVWTIYEITSEYDLKVISRKLNVKLESKTVVDAEGDNIELKSAIECIKLIKNKIRGVFKYEELFESEDWDHKRISNPRTKTIEFTFVSGSMHLFINANHNESTKLTNVLENIMFRDEIIQKRIMPTKLDDFILDNHCELYYCSWKELVIANVSTSSISGRTLKDSTEYGHYDKHGVKNSVLFKCPTIDATIQITRNGSVSFRTKSSRDEIEDIIRQDVLPLCQ